MVGGWIASLLHDLLASLLVGFRLLEAFFKTIAPIKSNGDDDSRMDEFMMMVLMIIISVMLRMAMTLTKTTMQTHADAG